jgi:hypothetical protein
MRQNAFLYADRMQQCIGFSAPCRHWCRHNLAVCGCFDRKNKVVKATHGSDVIIQLCTHVIRGILATQRETNNPSFLIFPHQCPPQARRIKASTVTLLIALLLFRRSLQSCTRENARFFPHCGSRLFSGCTRWVTSCSEPFPFNDDNSSCPVVHAHVHR